MYAQFGVCCSSWNYLYATYLASGGAPKATLGKRASGKRQARSEWATHSRRFLSFYGVLRMREISAKTGRVAVSHRSGMDRTDAADDLGGFTARLQCLAPPRIIPGVSRCRCWTDSEVENGGCFPTGQRRHLHERQHIQLFPECFIAVPPRPIFAHGAIVKVMPTGNVRATATSASQIAFDNGAFEPRALPTREKTPRIVEWASNDPGCGSCEAHRRASVARHVYRGRSRSMTDMRCMTRN